MLPEYVEEPIRNKFLPIIHSVVYSLPEEPNDVFISCTIKDGDATASYQAVWLFSDHYMSEIRDPLRSGRIQHDVARLSGLVDWVRLTARHDGFGDWESRSTLALEFSTNDGLSGTLYAVGPGCDHSMGIYRKRFFENFIPPEGSAVPGSSNGK